MDAKPTTRVVPADLVQKKADGDPIVMVSAYDGVFARLADESGVDAVLVGDSLVQVLGGAPSTLFATLEQMTYHTRLVVSGVRRAMVVTDMPFLSYQVSVGEAVRNAGTVVKESGCHAVKLEGGRVVADAVAAIVGIGIPVMGHVGFTPQSVHAMGRRVQGRTDAARSRLLADVKALEDAGAFAIVVELVPRPLGGELAEAVTVPTIGIGAGAGCDGQVLVMHDLLGLNDHFRPKFLKRYANLADEVRQAVTAFALDVRERRYPDDGHSFD